jgi:hypothetical protein
MPEGVDMPTQVGGTVTGSGGAKIAGLVLSDLLFLLFDYSNIRGGGKCPEEEHTTCSGGPGP